ncbi:MAG: metallophosphoesterase [Deinococcus sp.]|nr:metallophosphoesterase [Deinococcus sp.]
MARRHHLASGKADLAPCRIAAVGDLHCHAATVERIRGFLAEATAQADLLLLAGDLTENGTPLEAELLASCLGEVPVPVAVVLGNHDWDPLANRANGAQREARRTVAGAAQVLDGRSVLFQSGNRTIGIAGASGCYGDLGEARYVSAFQSRLNGVPYDDFVLGELKKVVAALDEVQLADVRILLLHYAPIEGTVAGEAAHLYPVCGHRAVGSIIDRYRPHLVIHGHCHYGTAFAKSLGGVPVYNVAHQVTGGVSYFWV